MASANAMNVQKRKPVVFACAGCSAAGRLAYELALELDRRQAAEMSCLAGLAAELRPFTRLIAGRPVWVVDGCPIQCARAIFARLSRPIDSHIRLQDYGVRKKTGLQYGTVLEALADRVVDGLSLQATSASTSDVVEQHNSCKTQTDLHDSGLDGL
jgi:uncharacterized metal-binding protein